PHVTIPLLPDFGGVTPKECLLPCCCWCNEDLSHQSFFIFFCSAVSSGNSGLFNVLLVASLLVFDGWSSSFSVDFGDD
ncbi:hypothetical protein Tco_0982807, partial [Tanacetum coccineum]